tara:strand:+ start:249 stop:398 length:150 start_codon:yes stop_codon:yes gene_type:complete
MIKKILTFWMEKDPAKDPQMDNVMRVIVLSLMGYIVYSAIVAIIERVYS